MQLPYFDTHLHRDIDLPGCLDMIAELWQDAQRSGRQFTVIILTRCQFCQAAATSALAAFQVVSNRIEVQTQFKPIDSVLIALLG